MMPPEVSFPPSSSAFFLESSFLGGLWMQWSKDGFTKFWSQISGVQQSQQQVGGFLSLTVLMAVCGKVLRGLAWCLGTLNLPLRGFDGVLSFAGLALFAFYWNGRWRCVPQTVVTENEQRVAPKDTGSEQQVSDLTQALPCLVSLP